MVKLRSSSRNFHKLHLRVVHTSPGNCTCRGSLHREKNTIASHPYPPELRPSFERAQAKRAHLKVALLAERHARGPR